MKQKLLAILTGAALLAGCECGQEDQNVIIGSAPTPGTAEDFRLNIKDRVFFPLNKSNLTTEAHETLKSQAGWLKTYANTNIIVEGHCDERGTLEYNQALGAHRAASVKKNLSHLGVNSKRIQTISYGKSKPPVDGHNESAWAQNRTAVTVVE
ncbi:MAG: peptidoglycan-associated lipoprotein Pal [Alphaproteobacteria bacterium]